jgi:two-component system response regulator QseB
VRILLIEDDELLGDGLKTGLKLEGHTVDWLKDGLSAQNAIKSEPFDVIILDIGLPKRSGSEVLMRMRNDGNETPVIVLTAKTDVADRVDALDLGSDDYITKPFDLTELCARLRALHRRSSGRAEAIIRCGELSLHPASHTVKSGEKTVNVSPKEFALLEKLMANVGRVLSREQLAETLYGWDKDIDSNAVEVHIHNIRKKLNTSCIRTIRGVGYIIEEEQAE